MYDAFIDKLGKAGNEFLNVALGVDSPIEIVSHFDTDGLCAASIIMQALGKENIPFTKTIVQNINNDVLDEISGDIVIFLDVGAAKLASIQEKLVGKTIYILDHHEPQGESSFINHYNPHIEGITQRNAISGAGVAYFFALGMNSENRSLAHLAVLGALGDTQERNGFMELNNRILQHAIIQKNIKIGQRIRLFGLTSRPVLKVLEYSTDIDIPGVTGSEEGTKQLLDDLCIQYEWRGRLKKWYNLRPYDQEKLTNKILELKKGTPKEELIMPTYSLTNPDYRQELIDMKEFATIINACGRLEEYDVALNALQADPVGQQQAIMQLRTYKSAIHESLQLVDALRNNNQLIQTDNYVIINFKDALRSSLAGIIASILSRNKIYKEGVVVCTLAKDSKDATKTKVSLRLNKHTSGIRLQRILEKITKKFGADAGGHDHAAGAVIKTEDEEAFIKALEKELNSQ
ncbi:DHH family phosphoesterase [Candidatus Woesearchaeota archaeon]|nr:DHH family phosphoesterase [Candidatus Woesearchaeota archaeon]